MSEPIFLFALLDKRTGCRNIAMVPQSDVAKFAEELQHRPHIEVEHRLGPMERGEADFIRNNLCSRLDEYRTEDGWYGCSYEEMQTFLNAAMASAMDPKTNLEVAARNDDDKHYSERYLGPNYTTNLDWWLRH